MTSFFAIILSVIAAALGPLLKVVFDVALRRARPRRRLLAPSETTELRLQGVKPATLVLFGFLLLVIVFGAFSGFLYWEKLVAARDTLFFGGWLFLTMTGGMFVQVLTSNYRNGRELFDVSATQLIFPVLFSVIVFYPVWAIGASATDSLFAIYAAFLNGFFWQTVVANTQLPTPSRTTSNENTTAGGNETVSQESKDIRELTIIAAVYGAHDKTNDVAERLRKRIVDGKLTVYVGNDTLGPDPIDKVPKRLEITYSYGGKTFTKSVPEYEVLSIP